MSREQTERKICAEICKGNGLKAKEIARQLNIDRSTVNRVLYASPLLKDLCYQDDSFRWHGIIRQSVPHDGLYEFSGYYARVSDFLKLTEDEWMDELKKGCQRIGRNLNDTRGLLHSFRDCREQMINLFVSAETRTICSYLRGRSCDYGKQGFLFGIQNERQNRFRRSFTSGKVCSVP